MLYSPNFREDILFEPIKQGADSLKIISGYATHTMSSWHIKGIADKKLPPINITLIVGMCRFDGIIQAVHDGFNSIMSLNNTPKQSNFICQYVVKGAPIHSKVYIWEKGGNPLCAFMGSANYTQSAFSNQRKRINAGM